MTLVSKSIHVGSFVLDQREVYGGRKLPIELIRRLEEKDAQRAWTGLPVVLSMVLLIMGLIRTCWIVAVKLVVGTGPPEPFQQLTSSGRPSIGELKLWVQPGLAPLSHFNN